jgi:hypothetical protein
MKHDGTPGSILQRVFGFFQDMHRFGHTYWHPGQPANLVVFNVSILEVLVHISQVGMDKGQGWISLTLLSPMIIKGNSPERSLTLCLVEGDDSHLQIKTHFGLYFEAFWPLIEGAVPEPSMDTWLDSAPTSLPPLPTWEVEIEHNPPPSRKKAQQKRRKKRIRKFRPSTKQQPLPTTAAAAAAPQPVQLVDCWCPHGIFHKFKCPDERVKAQPTSTAKTGIVPQPCIQWRTCSSCRHRFHLFCVPNNSGSWRCAVCVASEAGDTAAYVIATHAQTGVITLAAVLEAAETRCDENNNAWSATCFACTQESPESPEPPEKLKKGAKWNFCFTLCLDMMADWSVKGMPKTWSQEHPCTTCFIEKNDLTMGRAHGQEHHEFGPRRWQDFKNEGLECVQPFFTSWQEVPSPLHLLLGFGGYFLERLEVSAPRIPCTRAIFCREWRKFWIGPAMIRGSRLHWSRSR